MVTRLNWLDLERKASRRQGNQLELAGGLEVGEDCGFIGPGEFEK